MLSEMKLMYDALPFIRELEQLQQVGLAPNGAAPSAQATSCTGGLATGPAELNPSRLSSGSRFLQGSWASAFMLTSDLRLTFMPGTLRAPCREVATAYPCLTQ